MRGSKAQKRLYRKRFQPISYCNGLAGIFIEYDIILIRNRLAQTLDAAITIGMMLNDTGADPFGADRYEYQVTSPNNRSKPGIKRITPPLSNAMYGFYPKSNHYFKKMA